MTRPEGGAPVTGLRAEERWFPAGKARQVLTPGSAPGFFPGPELRGIPVLAVHQTHGTFHLVSLQIHRAQLYRAGYLERSEDRPIALTFSCV